MVSKNKNGFTLIELLVVIVLISILASIGLYSYMRVRKQARDVRRREDIAAIAGALQLYYQDNGKYVNNATPITNFTNTSSVLTPLSTGGYINLPSPVMTSYPYQYCTEGSYNYIVRAALEIPKGSALNKNSTLCSESGYYISGDYIDNNGAGASYTSKSTGYD